MRFGRRQPRPEPNRCLGAISVRSWPRSALGHLVTVEPTINLLLCAQVDLINVKWGHCKNQKRPITWKGVSMVGELLRQSVGSVAAVFSLWDFRLARSSSLSIGRGSRVAGRIRCARCVAPAFHFFVCACMPDPKHFEACFLCRQAFEFGSHAYEGMKIPAWDMVVCTSCYESNRDGIVAEAFPHLIPYLKSRGVEVRLNTRGWIDWPS